MRTTDPFLILVPPRQRKSHKPSAIESLKKSIVSKGLFHPPIVSVKEDGTMELVAGMGRLIAMKELIADSLSFFHDGQPVPSGSVPYALITDLSPADLAEAELEENVFRSNLEWQEESAARVLIHSLRSGQNPGQTQTDTAKEIVAIKGAPPEDVARERIALNKSLLVEAHKNTDEVKSAKSLSQAYTAIVRKTENQFQRRLLELAPQTSPHKVIKGDCRDIMPSLPAGTYDTILCDPPYGIDADEMKKTGKHHYDDSKEYALDVCRFILSEGFRLLKPRGIVFMFCDFEHFLALRTHADNVPYTVWRTPIIWDKPGYGHAPWGSMGFMRSYECILFAVKGQKPLAEPGGPDVIEYKRVDRRAREHAAEKPEELLEFLLRRACIPGDAVLDPCAGSGSILGPATRLSVAATCIELSDAYHAAACARIAREEAAG